jgi:AT-rich interactive domain-containing protein 1
MDDLSYIQTHFDPLPMDETPILSFQKEEISDELDLNSTSILFTQYSLGYDQICSRCICVSSIIRNLSFISTNDLEIIKNPTLIHLFARLLSLKHDFHHSLSDKKSSSYSECLPNIRENTLVTLANISPVLIFDQYDSVSINQLIDGLLHYSTKEPITTQRLSIEILTKLSINDMNIDFILATPPFSRIISLFNILIDWLNVDERNNFTRSQREFAIVLFNALIQCDINIVHRITHISYVTSLLINFFEDYEIKTNELILRDGLDNVLGLINSEKAEEIFFTTNDMLKRAGNCLLSILNSTNHIEKI